MDIIRFIIIATPPVLLLEQIQELRITIANITGSSAALAYPPHVTIRTGALVPVDEAENFINEFGKCVAAAPGCTMESSGIDYGTYGPEGSEKYYIFYRIKKTEGIQQLHRSLLSYSSYIKSTQTYYEPHLTIAFEDLLPGRIRPAFDYIKNNHEKITCYFSFPVNTVSLYINEKGIWKNYISFPTAAIKEYA